MMPPIMLALAAAAQAPAQTDLTATYTPPGSGASVGMKVEVARNGNMRFELGGGMISFIRRDGHTYLLAPHGKQPLVADIADLRTAARESYQKSGANLCEAFGAKAAAAKLVQQGTATVNGRSGDAWFKQMADGNVSAKAEVVVSHDPALARLGAAVAEEYRAGTSMLPDCPAFSAMWAPMEAVLDSGTPLALSGMELTALDEAPIDPKRFELPAPPATLEQIRQNQIAGHHD